MNTLPMVSQEKPEDQSYKLLFEKSPQPMWVYDRETLAFLAVNDAAILHYGYSREEFLAMTIKDIRDLQDVRDVIDMANRVNGKYFHDVRMWQHRKKDGTPIYVEITSNDETWSGRRARLVLVTDVTERKQAERQVLDWQRRYEAAIQASGQILYDWNLANDQITYAGSIREKLGYDETELAGGIARFTQLVHPEDREMFEREVKRVTDKHEPLTLEFRLAKKDDAVYVSIEAKGHFFHDEVSDTWRMIGFLTDVTPRRLLEAQFIQAQKMEAVGHLAGGVAHDFNNILGIILGYSQLLEQKDLPNDVHSYASEICTAAKRAAVLTKQLLAFGRKQMLQPKILNLNSVLDGIDKSLLRLTTKEIELVIFRNPELGNVRLDQIQMEQVIMNLVINARDAMPEGGKLTIETTNVYLDSEYCQMHPKVRPGHYVMLAVSDTGIGMDSITLSRIFEPFFTTKDQDRGTGLGLAMVYGTVRQSGGHVWVYSEPGEGAVFKLYFPRVDQTVDPIIDEKPDQDMSGSETVLVAEDEESYRKLVAHILEGNGYKVLSASNGIEALEVSQSFAGSIHLLLTDAVLPKLNGRKLAEQMSRLRPNMRVLYMSGYTSNVVIHHGMLDQGIEFLHKPFTPNLLLGKIRDLLDERLPSSDSPTGFKREAAWSVNPRHTILCVDDDPAALKLTKMLLEGTGHIVLTASRGEMALEIVQSTRVDLVLTDRKMIGMTGAQVARMVKEVNPGVLVAILSGWEEATEGDQCADMVIAKTDVPAKMLEKIASLLKSTPGSEIRFR